MNRNGRSDSVADPIGPLVSGAPAQGTGKGSDDRVVNSELLLSVRGTLAIRHRQSIYYLRETRFGKLILTK